MKSILKALMSLYVAPRVHRSTGKPAPASVVRWLQYLAARKIAVMST
jgi:hypothetical protein